MSEPASAQSGERRGRFRYDIANLEATLAGIPVQVVDLSLTGIGLLTDEPLPIDSRHDLRLDTELGELATRPQVIWCQAEPSEESEESEPAESGHRVGLRFPPLPPGEANLLQHLLELQSNLSKRQPDRPQEESTSIFNEEEIEEVIRQADEEESESSR